MPCSAALGCGPSCQCGGACGCGGGFGGHQARRRYPAIEQTLKAYIAQQTKDGRYFYISPALNTGRVQSSFGDATGWSGATGEWDTNSADPMANPLDLSISGVAQAIGDYMAGVWGGSPPDVSMLPPNGGWGGVSASWAPAVTAAGAPTAALPPALQTPVVRAASQDLFGNPVAPWIVGGAAALLLVTLLLPSKGRRRRAA